jgi:hypothetical protein
MSFHVTFCNFLSISSVIGLFCPAFDKVGRAEQVRRGRGSQICLPNINYQRQGATLPELYLMCPQYTDTGFSFATTIMDPGDASA